MQTLVGKSESELIDVVVGLDAPAYRGRQLAQALYRRFVRGCEEIPELPKTLRERLSEEFALAPCAVRTAQSAPDGTTKYLVELPDSEVVEAVFLPYSGRNTVCLSSQVGCPMACSFCATGTEGLARNLTAGEIVDQVLLLQSRHEESRIDHVVYMGMGEPLLNLPNVLKSLELLHTEVGLSYRNLTVSTVGVVPQMAKLAEADLPITLAVSLHAATDALRSQLVPLNEKYPVAVLMDACKSYVEKTRRRITFEYVLLSGVNDTDQQAHALGALLKKQPLCALNTIPYNATDVAARYRRPTPDSTRRFREIVGSYGVTVTQRAEKGHRIAAACGQLKRSALTPGRTMRPLPMAGSHPR
jgi:23S rRNA (adenine2503-C2)-methyltransferase